MGDINTASNVYWSLRKYFYDVLPSLTVVYATNQLAAPSVNSWVAVQELDTPRLDRITVVNYRIHCVVRNNADDIPMQDLVTQIINAFESVNAIKMIVVYDKTTSSVVGRMHVSDIKTRPSVPYEGGITVRPIDITLRYLSNRHA